MDTRYRHRIALLVVASSKCVLTQSSQVCQLVNGIISSYPIVCQHVTNAAFQQIYQLICLHKCVLQIIRSFVGASVCPWPLVDTFLSASIAQLLVKFSTSALACPHDHKLVHQCVRAHDHLSTYALLTHTCELVGRALGNLSICAPLSGQSPA